MESTQLYAVTAMWFVLGLVLVAPLLFWVSRGETVSIRPIAVALSVAAVIYVLFYLFWGVNSEWLIVELLGWFVFSGFAWLGIRYSLWWLVAGWLLHPLWDVGLHIFAAGDHFTPYWYPVTCVSFDLAVGLFLVLFIFRNQLDNENTPDKK